MTKLKRLAFSFTIMSVLAVGTFAGEMPCPCAPGETNAPPCSSAPVSNNNSAAPGETNSPPAAKAVDVIDVAEVALWMLLLF